MAKNDIEPVETEEIEVDEKKPGFFQKLFFWFLVPVMFTIAVLLIVAQFTNTNVFQFAEGLTDKIPFIGSSNEKEVVENTALNKQKVVELEASLKEKEAEIEKLQTQIETEKASYEQLQMQQEKLLQEIETLKKQQEEVALEFQEILKTYEGMSAKSAAAILVEMSDEEALRILSSMKSSQLTEIFSKMSAADAARYTELLAGQ